MQNFYGVKATLNLNLLMFRCEIDGNINVFGPIYEIQYIISLRLLPMIAVYSTAIYFTASVM